MADPSLPHTARARAALRAIVSDPLHGPAALSQTQTIANLLKDLLPDAPRETGLLIAAAGAGLAESLNDHIRHGMDSSTAIRLAASAMSESSAFPPEACHWVAGEMAVALGLSDPASLPVRPATGQPEAGGRPAPSFRPARHQPAQPAPTAQPTPTAPTASARFGEPPQIAPPLFGTSPGTEPPRFGASFLATPPAAVVLGDGIGDVPIPGTGAGSFPASLLQVAPGRGAPDRKRPWAALPGTIRGAVVAMRAGAAIRVLAMITLVLGAGRIRAQISAASGGLSPRLVGGTVVVFLIVSIAIGLMEALLWLWMAAANRRGHRWARVTATIFFAVGTVGFALSVVAIHSAGFQLLEIAGWLDAVVATSLIWLGPSSAYYRTAGAPAI